MKAILEKIDLLFADKISVTDMSQDEIVEALDIMRRKYSALLDADTRPPLEHTIYEAVRNKTLQ